MQQPELTPSEQAYNDTLIHINNNPLVNGELHAYSALAVIAAHYDTNEKLVEMFTESPGVAPGYKQGLAHMLKQHAQTLMKQAKRAEKAAKKGMN